MREPQLLNHIYGRSADLTAAFPHVLVGPGHDCAVVEAALRTLLKVDSVIEGVHFVSGTPLDAIAYKAVARTVSDIAAMAGKPRAALAACVLPRSWSDHQADELFDATARHARAFGCPLVGGDIASHDGPLVLTITVMGDAPSGRLALRSGAKPGDAIYVTGSLGGSLGRDRMGRHLRPMPRLAEASWLHATLGEGLHAMMDLSDGLGVDAGRMGAASAVRMLIDESLIPVHQEAAGIASAISDGEDYELLFAAASNLAVPQACPITGVTFTRVGTVEPGPGGAWLRTRGGATVDIGSKGFTHR